MNTQAKIAELQARVEAEKVRVIATQALEAQPQEHYETYYEIANCIELHADELQKIAEGTMTNAELRELTEVGDE